MQSGSARTNRTQARIAQARIKHARAHPADGQLRVLHAVLLGRALAERAPVAAHDRGVAEVAVHACAQRKRVSSGAGNVRLAGCRR
jgi:hypothetical protein